MPSANGVGDIWGIPRGSAVQRPLRGRPFGRVQDKGVARQIAGEADAGRQDDLVIRTAPTAGVGGEDEEFEDLHRSVWAAGKWVQSAVFRACFDLIAQQACDLKVLTPDGGFEIGIQGGSVPAFGPPCSAGGTCLVLECPCACLLEPAPNPSANTS